VAGGFGRAAFVAVFMTASSPLLPLVLAIFAPILLLPGSFGAVASALLGGGLRLASPILHPGHHQRGAGQGKLQSCNRTIANVVLFHASGEVFFITGSKIVDGDYTAF
jgi:hypothetical protein